MKDLAHSRWFHPLLLLVWLAVGTGLRFTQLASKPPWTDEFSTLVFSLGQSFRTVPLNQAIALDTLLQPLQHDPQAGISSVITNLLQESNHPPLYFVLAHLWMRLFAEEGLVSIWVARSLPALFGAASIPAMFGLGVLAFRSKLAGQLAAAMIAVSPFGVFLAQEARHYSLAILWVIASLCCFVIATRAVRDRSSLSLGLGLLWVGINSLGIATHYFFALTLFAQAIVLIAQGLLQTLEARRSDSKERNPLLQPYWQRIYMVAAGTLAGGLAWVPFLQNIYGSELTQWISNNGGGGLAWLSPIFQALAAWITMLSLLPVEADALPVVIVSGVVMLIFFVWATPIICRGLRIQWFQSETALATQVLSGFVVGAIFLFFVITYGLGSDLTRGARYNFVYFPAVMALLGASLATCWRTPLSVFTQDKTTSQVKKRLLFMQNLQFLPFEAATEKAIALIWLMGLLSGLTVVSNLGYQKYYRPDLLASMIQATSQAPVLVATTHQTHVQTGEIMGLGLEFKAEEVIRPTLPSTSNAIAEAPQFLLAHRATNLCQENCPATAALQQTVAQSPRPLDLWLVNFYAPVNLEGQNCTADLQLKEAVNGYDYQLYHCQ